MKRLIAVCAALALISSAGVAFVCAGGVRACRLGLEDGVSQLRGGCELGFHGGRVRCAPKGWRRPAAYSRLFRAQFGPAGPAHPGRLFADGRYGVTSVVAGRAGVNDLWQAIEVGAFAPHMPKGSRRVVIFASMQWFMCYRDPASTFPGVFSQGAYDAFMANPSISREMKARVVERVRTYGVEDADGSASTPLGFVNAADRAATSLASDLRLAQSFARGWGRGEPHDPKASAGKQGTAGGKTAALDWGALIEEGKQRASKGSSNNEYGFYDGWYEKKFAAWLDGAQRAWHVDDGVYFSQQEYEDFGSCSRLPASGRRAAHRYPARQGKAYDQTIYTREVREAYYTTIRAICDRMDVEVADFSGYEYDPLFLRDYSHPSAYGSAYTPRLSMTFGRANHGDLGINS